MKDSKQWYLSKGLWGGVVVIAITGLTLAGYVAEAGEVTEMANSTLDWVKQGVILAAGWVALIGRIRATKQIG